MGRLAVEPLAAAIDDPEHARRARDGPPADGPARSASRPAAAPGDRAARDPGVACPLRRRRWADVARTPRPAPGASRGSTVARRVSPLARCGTAPRLGDWGFMPPIPTAARRLERGPPSSAPGSASGSTTARHASSADDAVRREAAAPSAAPRRRRARQRPVRGPHRREIAGRVTHQPGPVAGVRRCRPRRRRVMDEAGIRIVSTSAPDRDEARRAPVRHDGSDPRPVPRHGHWTFGAGGDPVAAVRVPRPRLARPLQGRDPAVMAAPRTRGTGPSPSATACSASSAPARRLPRRPGGARRDRLRRLDRRRAGRPARDGHAARERAAARTSRALRCGRSASSGARPPASRPAAAAGRSNAVAIVTNRSSRAERQHALHHLHRVERHLAARPGRPAVADRVRHVHEADAPAVVLVRRRGERVLDRHLGPVRQRVRRAGRRASASSPRRGTGPGRRTGSGPRAGRGRGCRSCPRCRRSRSAAAPSPRRRSSR